ncbi:MAG: Fic family protein [bacterium]|nr:Fic family protein [bacterium]MDT8366331.1 Fic family protein [bacterium]
MSDTKNIISKPVTVFHDRRLPERAEPVGYAALIDSCGLVVPLPRRLCAIGARHKIYEENGWRIFTPRYRPEPTLDGHLTFALKYEGLDLAVLKRVFGAVGERAVETLVRARPTGGYSRRIWFLYEWLTGARLDLPDARKGTYALVVDPEKQWAVTGETSSRHRVKNNLPGTPAFCPMIERTRSLDDFVGMNLTERARRVVADVPKDLVARAAAFLLIKDSRSSYAIEGERAPQSRIHRWGRVIGQAGTQPLDEDEFLRLQGIVIGDGRFVRIGWRADGGFVGEHDRETRAPLPVHISASPRDLPGLIEGLIDFDRGAARELDPVLAAAVLAFGFVYIHPFVDGNGRIHRYLIHHILAQRGFNPPGVVFPVSAAILERVDEYRQVLESYSARLVPLIQWRATPENNIEVLNETADFYRYFDATAHAEFLFSCVARTIEVDLPNETGFLRRYDLFRKRVEEMIDMPGGTVDLLFRFIRQNDGKLSGQAREKEFVALTDEEAAQIEEIYRRTQEE